MGIDSMGKVKYHSFDGFGRIVRERYAIHGPKPKKTKESDQCIPTESKNSPNGTPNSGAS